MEILSCFDIQLPKGTAMLVCSLPMKSRNRLPHDMVRCMYTSAAHAGHSHDVMDAIKMAQLTAMFSKLSIQMPFFPLFFNKRLVNKPHQKTAVSVFFSFIPIDRPHLLGEVL